MAHNAFKAALREGRRQLGLWCTLPGSFATEVVAGAGYDWLLFDTEHSPGDPLTVLPQLQAAAGYPAVSPVVGPAFPMCRTLRKRKPPCAPRAIRRTASAASRR